MRAVVTFIAGCVLLLAALPAATPAALAADITIYRCTDARGRLTLRDTPCPKGQQQQTRSMVRPKDGAPAPVPAEPVAPTRQAPAPPATRVIVRNAPQPLYECITPDGERYTSDTSEGHPRWVPLWTLGYPVYRGGWQHGGVRSSVDIDLGHVRIHSGQHGGSRPPPGVGYPAGAYNAGTWIRDTCHALPPQEVCARLVDRRDEIRRRFFNAMPSERDVLRVEERGINARLDNDCGVH